MGNNNAIWDIYDNYRSARLNVKYYCCRLVFYEKWNFAFEILIAIAAPSSVISGVLFLQTQSGLAVWKFISAVAAIVGFLKPFLKFGHKIKFYEQTLSGYRALEYDLYEIILKIRDEGTYSASSKKMFEAAMKKKKVLVTNPPENTPNEKLVAKLTEEVNQEIPTESLYFPEE
ncbi:MAG: hypothetical protein K2P84_00865 [Undibacterium sp.]|nr:hypothetical protein [Undibacterium sp.]